MYIEPVIAIVFGPGRPIVQGWLHSPLIAHWALSVFAFLPFALALALALTIALATILSTITTTFALALALTIAPGTLCIPQRAVWLDVAGLLAFEANSCIRAVVGVLLAIGPLPISLWLSNHQGLRLSRFRLGLLPIALIALIVPLI